MNKANKILFLKKKIDLSLADAKIFKNLFQKSYIFSPRCTSNIIEHFKIKKKNLKKNLKYLKRQFKTVFAKNTQITF